MSSRRVRAAATLMAAMSMTVAGFVGAPAAVGAPSGSATFTVTGRDDYTGRTARGDDTDRSVGGKFSRDNGFDDGSGILLIRVRDRIDGHPLAGARFVFTTCPGQSRGSAVTDATGVVLRTLPAGCYRARQVAAPSGYLDTGVGGTVHVESDATDHYEVLSVPIGHVRNRNVATRMRLSGIEAGSSTRA